ncbi:MAG: MlaD family protein [Planctomycetota bacterium]|nr:MlaD family protein [Planctomycetota bacterium]
MKPAIRDTIVGLTAVIGLAGLVVLLMLFGELAAFQKKTYSVTLRMNTAEGLVAGSSVTLNGVPVGEIDTLIATTYPSPGVVATLDIEEGVLIPRDSNVVILIGLLGEGTLALTGPPIIDPSRAPDYLQPGESLTTRASTLLDELSTLLDTRLGGLNEAAASLVRLSDQYTLVGQRIDDLLAPRTPEEVDAGLERPNVVSAITRVSTAVAEAQKWLGDDIMREDVRDSISRMPQLLDDASLALEQWTQTAQTIEARADQLGDSFENLAREVQRSADSVAVTVEEVRRMAASINEGEGSLALLLNDPALYRNLNDAAERLEIVLTEAQLFLEKVQAEGIPLNF